MISIHQFGAQSEAVGQRTLAGDIEWSEPADMVRDLQELVLRGDVRRISIADANGRTLVEVPHLLGNRGGAAMDPSWAAVDALARVAGRLTIHVDYDEGWPGARGPAGSAVEPQRARAIRS